MCVALAAGIVAAFLVVVLATPTKRAEAAFPGNNGKIAFVKGSEIATIEANGDNQTRLTKNREDDSEPVFSANGKKIAFESDRSGDRSGNLDIFTMSADGTDKKNVTRSLRSESDPTWSPDGNRIAFDATRKGNLDIYVINKDGTGLTRITTSPQSDDDPAWSPDGTKIAFVRVTPNLDRKIYVMKAAPESETNIPQPLITSGSGVNEYDPSWSPNGNRIAFERNLFELYSIRADGSDQIRLTTTSRSRDQAAWSPDGTKIAFSGKRQGTHDDNTWGILVMKAAPESATNRPKRISDNGYDTSPDWQPLR
jgi:Tol biopolymer transport system component